MYNASLTLDYGKLNAQYYSAQAYQHKNKWQLKNTVLLSILSLRTAFPLVNNRHNSNTTHIVWGTLLVAQLVGLLCYKAEGRGFDFQWCHWNVSLT
jgi:hypothetical protein